MRIVIDMQGAQSESRFRGIGRHTMAFARAVVRNRGQHEVFLALNGLFADSVEPIRSAFHGLLPKENIRVWYAPGPVKECDPANHPRRVVAEQIREAFLASLKPDIIHIVSMFEGFIDDAVISIGRFDLSTPVTVTIHDLIPLLNPDHYLSPNPGFERFYRNKLKQLIRADQFLTISESALEESVGNLDCGDRPFVNISSAIDPAFRQVDVSRADAEEFCQKFRVQQPFVLYTGGADERKNLPRLIDAFASLPDEIQREHQLVLAGKMSDENIATLSERARRQGVSRDSLCFTGYVSDHDLILLYNLCRLYVFPSWHEGFGLPVLEAMACGAPVIGARSSSLPEVIGLEEAMFDPFSVESLRQKMLDGLKDDGFRARLQEHAKVQASKFSWDKTAQRAIDAWGSLCEGHTAVQRAPLPSGKPTLAFVSPMPPERTGIADYSADLLPALADYYHIELVVAQKHVTPINSEKGVNVRSVDWLRSNVDRIDRVIYQMGNSPFHQHMLALIRDIPGTVVLHDFYLSGLMSWLECDAGEINAWVDALYCSHGYPAVTERYANPREAKLKYPANLGVLQKADGIIVHSEYSRNLIQQWFGGLCEWPVEVIPLVRQPPEQLDKKQARKVLGLNPDDFIICSFGFLDATKLNHRLLESWLNSELAVAENTKLVFVGQCPDDDYGNSLRKRIEESGLGDRIHITGYASQDDFRQYLMASDLAVQLRAQSRGETSAAVLDCMGYGVPVVVNANGSMAELDKQAVRLLDDEFSNSELTYALESLWEDVSERQRLSARARQAILSNHSPAECSRRYREAIEQFSREAATGRDSLIDAIASNPETIQEDEILSLSECIAASLPVRRPHKRLLLDITATCRNDLKTGIERVARSILMTLPGLCPEDYRIEPVYLSESGGRWHYRYARKYYLELLGCPSEVLKDDVVAPGMGDILLGLDLSGEQLVQAEQSGLYADYRNRGVPAYFTVFDLLPVQMPEVFPSGTATAHERWLSAVSRLDGALCISQTVARDLEQWLSENDLQRGREGAFRVDWFHLGADVESSAPTMGMPSNAKELLEECSSRPTFLMVGTIEPRKGHLSAISAFEQLWQNGLDANLVVVGQEGWRDLPAAERSGIIKVVQQLKNHPESGKRLFWLQGISDEYLEEIYAASACLIAASYGEGFGLPLIEAAQHNVPLIVRDIPVFREVAGSAAEFFESDSDLAQVIERFLETPSVAGRQATNSNQIQWLTWRESASRLLEALFSRGHNDSETLP